MLNRLRSLFQSDDQNVTIDPEERLRLATAALFIEMTRADFEVTDDERAAVVEAIQRQLGLTSEETTDLVSAAETQVDDSISLYDFTALVNRELSADEKVEVIERMWEIGFSDSVLEKHEEFLVRKVARLIHVPHRDFIAAKKRARKRLNESGH